MLGRAKGCLLLHSCAERVVVFDSVDLVEMGDLVSSSVIESASVGAFGENVKADVFFNGRIGINIGNVFLIIEKSHTILSMLSFFIVNNQ